MTINFVQEKWLLFLIGYFLIIVMQVICSLIENDRQTKLIFLKSSQRGLILVSFLTFIGFSIMFYFINITSVISQFVLLFVLFKKIVMASFTSAEAEELGRDKILWWFLGFFECHSALIILGLSSSLVNLPKNDVGKINYIFRRKKNDLSILRNSNLINDVEFKLKLKSIKKIYFDQINYSTNLIKDFVKESTHKASILKLEQAFKDNILTKDEYETKLKEVIKN